MHSLLYRKKLLQDFFNFHWLWLLSFLLVPSIWFYAVAGFVHPSFQLSKTLPHQMQNLQINCTSIILALKKSAHHAQKCTDWFLLEHYASIHINHFSSYKLCLPDPKGAGLNPYMICAQLQQSSLSTRELTIAAICSSVFSSRQQRYLVFNSRISNINFKQIFALICLMIAPTS
jgi:hypothetical protein